MLIRNDWVVIIVNSFHAGPLQTIIAVSLILDWLDFDWHMSLQQTLEPLLQQNLPMARTQLELQASPVASGSQQGLLKCGSCPTTSASPGTLLHNADS